MNFDDLRLLRFIVDEPNLTRAAVEMGVSTSALSKRLKNLEQKLQVELFERHGALGLRPTDLARELAHVSESVTDIWSRGLERVLHAHAARPATVVLAGPEVFMREVLLHFWTQERVRSPNLRLEARIDRTSGLSVDQLDEGVDALILNREDPRAGVVFRELFREEWGIVRHPDDAQLKLKDLRWATHSRWNNHIERFLPTLFHSGQCEVDTYWQDLTSLGILVAESRGLASILPRHGVAWMMKKGKVHFEPIRQLDDFPLFLAYKASSTHRELLHRVATFFEGE